MVPKAVAPDWTHAQALFLYLFLTSPILAALRADGFGENPFYHCLVAEILPAPGEPQGKNRDHRVLLPGQPQKVFPRCPEA